MNKWVCLLAILMLVGVVDAQESRGVVDSVAATDPDTYQQRRIEERHKKERAKLERVDANRDGKVDLNEYLAHAESRFRMMDLDSNGYVTVEERREVSEKMRKKHNEMREKHRSERKNDRDANE